MISSSTATIPRRVLSAAAHRNHQALSAFKRSPQVLARPSVPYPCVKRQLHSSDRSPTIDDDNIVPRPFEHSKAPLRDGQAVSEFAKEDERKLSGIPQEPTEGPPPTPCAAIPSHALFSLSNRTIIVAGAARGLGLTIARSLLESGAHVAALDVLPEPSNEAWEEAQQVAHDRNVTLSYGHLDVTDQEEIHEKFKGIFENAPAHAPVRGLFVSAGIQLMGPATEYKASDFRKLLDVNLTGTFLCAQAFGKEYIQRHPDEGCSVKNVADSVASTKGASIVLTASMSGSIANYYIEAAAYNASKAGVVQLGKNLAMEWGKKGVRVNTLSPGYIRTAMTAAQLEQKPELNDQWLRPALLGRISTPDEYRGPSIFLLSNASSFMTGGDLIVDGGHTAT